MSAVSSARKRSSRACDGCKQRRMKCEDIAPSATTGEPTCKLCREARVECTFETPVRKRGPAPGFRRRTGGDSGSPGRKDEQDSEDDERNDHVSSHVVSSSHHENSRAGNGSGDSGSTSPRPVLSAKRRRPPLLGLPPTLVDELLAVYFVHVHNVWPLIYKPMFNPHATSAPLLLSMLAIAACLERNPVAGGKDGLDADKLFAMAETALHHCRNESRLDVLQALMILSLRQTGCGDKRSAFSYAGRASCMALNLGLHMASTATLDAGETEQRARVYWNAYVLDKILAEETGRPCLLPYRRSSTPLPSVSEADEFETWPPQTASSAPLPRGVRHIVPRRGYVMTYFVWTTRLAMIVEDIVDLDVTPPPCVEPWDQHFVAALNARHDTIRRAEVIAQQLDDWRANMPPQIDVDHGSISPLPHHVIGLAWWYTAKIMLHSRFIKRYPRATNAPELSANAHKTCTAASEAVVDLLALLDRHKLLGQVSSDAIHMLSMITLFVAFDASDPDEELAHRAKVNFAQCCIWLRDFSSSWPAASAHKVFFEALIHGGLKLSSGDLDDTTGPAGPSPVSTVSPAVNSPSLPEGLRTMGRNLAGGSQPPTPVQRSMGPPATPGPAATPGGPSLFQLPQFYWNNIMSEGGAGPSDAPSGATMPWEWDLSDLGSTPVTLPQNDWNGSMGAQQGMNAGPSGSNGNDMGNGPPFTIPGTQGGTGEWNNASFMGGSGGGTASDQAAQAAIYSQLMSYMVEAAKGN